MNGANLFLVGIIGILGWYSYEIASRKKGQIWFKTKRCITGVGAYLTTAWILAEQGLPVGEAVAVGLFAGLGLGWLLVKIPKRNRRIPKAMRRQVIARDLTSKGLKWNSAKYHIDHVVPFSRGGDHSLRNLRVVEKESNLRKGGRMPSMREFLRK